jgi:hypothetical protein
MPSTSDLVFSVASGVGVAFVVIVLSIVLHAVEAAHFEPVRGPMGALARVGRGWLHTHRDHDVTDAVVAAILAVVPPCVAAAAMLGGASLTEGATILLISPLAPVMAALAGGSSSVSRLALDDALRRMARRAVLLTAVVASTSSSVGATVTILVIAAIVRQRFETPPGLQPRYDAALAAGTRLALEGGERAVVIVIAGIFGAQCARVLPAMVDFLTRPGTAAVWGIVGIVGVLSWVRFRGPTRAVAMGISTSLVLLAAALLAALFIP